MISILLQSIFIGQAYAVAICRRSWYLNNPRPAPRRCPDDGIFTYYECCPMSDECCQYVYWPVVIFLALVVLGMLAGCCCFLIFALKRNRSKAGATSKVLPGGGGEYAGREKNPEMVKSSRIERRNNLSFLPTFDAPPTRRTFEMTTPTGQMLPEMDAGFSYTTGRNAILPTPMSSEHVAYATPGRVEKHGQPESILSGRQMSGGVDDGGTLMKYSHTRNEYWKESRHGRSLNSRNASSSAL